MNFASELLDPFDGGGIDLFLRQQGYELVPDREFTIYRKTILQPRHVKDCVLSLKYNPKNQLWKMYVWMQDADTGILLEMSALFRRDQLLTPGNLAPTEESLLATWSRYTRFDHSELE